MEQTLHIAGIAGCQVEGILPNLRETSVVALPSNCETLSQKESNTKQNVHVHFPWHLHVHAQFGVDPAPVFRIMPVLFVIENKAFLVALLKIIFQTGLRQGAETLLDVD